MVELTTTITSILVIVGIIFLIGELLIVLFAILLAFVVDSNIRGAAIQYKLIKRIEAYSMLDLIHLNQADSLFNKLLYDGKEPLEYVDNLYYSLYAAMINYNTRKNGSPLNILDKVTKYFLLKFIRRALKKVRKLMVSDYEI